MAKGPTWTVEKIQDGLKRFYEEHKRYPTATEFDEYEFLPRAKTIERRFGGLIELRKQLKLGHEHDLRTGLHSSERARKINKRAHGIEKKVYDELVRRFGKEFVHREYFFTDDHRTRADFFVYDAGKGFCVDVFYPSSMGNLTGCLNVKLNKYRFPPEILSYPVIFLQMNEEIPQERLEGFLKKKKRPLGKGQSLMTWETFQRFCSGRNPLAILEKPM